MIKKYRINKPAWFNRYLLFVIFVALFFSSAMTWVEMDPVIDHQKNVDFLRMKTQQGTVTDSTNDSQKTKEIEILPARRDRQTDGIVFGSAFLAVIIIGGVIVNLRGI
ncbi:MAG: hypothetical protein CVU41_07915 [Chloroflexi bacterium HGW-Chloroflexi-3]|nr:MAG: hypothetical protein CVU41_07915 [Chloroflexi bacterium HGW-Chloroflexi-3]